MRKPVIVKVFLASVIIFAASIVLAVLATALGVGNLVMSGPDVTGYDFTASGIVAVTIAAIAVIAALGAIVLYLVAWVGAMVNAAQLAQPLWLLIVLLTGVFGVGLAGMIAYAIGAPDSIEERQSESAAPPMRPVADGSEADLPRAMRS